MPRGVRNSKRQSGLPAERVAELEQSLLTDPDDISVRQELMEYYFQEKYHSKQAYKASLRHTLWVIRHLPDAKLAGTPYVLLYAGIDDDAIQEAQELWKQQVATYPENTAVLDNAAMFFTMSVPDNRQHALELLHQAEVLQPSNPTWPKRLGKFFVLEQIRLDGDEKKTAAQNALRHYERAYDLTMNAEHKVLLLDDLAENALAAEEFPQAKEYAERLLTGAALCRDGVEKWNYGNALHRGHIVLGKIALRHGDRDAAKQHLMEAGNTPGSPQLDSFGPDWTLARELMKQGEKEAVLAYLKACSNFWEYGMDWLSFWADQIREGKVPDFEKRVPVPPRNRKQKV